MKRFLQQPIVWVIGGAIGLGLFLIIMLVLFRPRTPIPENIAKQLHFSLLYPDHSNPYKTDSATATYDSKASVLIFHVKNDKNNLTVSEQATPDQFSDIPEYYPKLIEKLHGYSDFDTINGKVSLTRPEELKGGQTAVFNGKGTLIFIHPEHDLSKDEWRDFFNSLVIFK